MKTLYLHIGPHKTASTYIQFQFVNNQTALEDIGIKYPPVELELPGHHRLAKIFRTNSWNSTASIEVLEQYKNISDNLLISSENFTLLNKEQIHALNKEFSEYDIRVLYFLRRANTLWFSHWQTLVKHGEVSTFDSYLLAAFGIYSQPNIDETKSKKVLDKWVKVLGENHVVIFPFEGIINDNTPIYEPVFEYMGIDKKNIKVVPKGKNPSSPPIQVEIIRQLNFLKQKIHPMSVSNEDVRIAYIKHASDIERSEIFVEFKYWFYTYRKQIKIDSNHLWVDHLYNDCIKQFSTNIVNPEYFLKNTKSKISIVDFISNDRVLDMKLINKIRKQYNLF